jgi:hypothetical protein
MKTRTRACCVGGIAAIVCLAILSAALASTGGVSPRDLAPDELWLIRGGQLNAINRCCQMNTRCFPPTMAPACNDHAKRKNSYYCRLSPEYVQPPVNRKNCNNHVHVTNGNCVDTPPATNPPAPCLEFYDCKCTGIFYCVCARKTTPSHTEPNAATCGDAGSPPC